MGIQAPNAQNNYGEVDDKLARQKAIDEWLPITSSRNAKWWYSAFHNVTAMVGAGVLSLPYAMAQLGWCVFTFTMFVGMTFPFFSGLLGFFGGFAFAPTTYFLPCIMWLAIYKPKKFSLSWWTNWICIVLGLLLITLAPIGGLRQIILSAKGYKFYS
ncbi:Amino acid transporter, transmembrane domain containing protein [Trema orientale]|uniref:Amino acid transporter, transmembrane domain containing protein n=1 Tax=Trema orientale TaxID=63057 RepID=A0A2P5FBV7_TREOI|nr:Amino acid transporter, transmembrane domain containing protein [Trema orientale]